MPDSPRHRPTRILFLQTQAELAGAQEISRLLGEELSRPHRPGIAEFEAHHLFLYKKTNGCDHFPNVHFAADRRPCGLVENIRLFRNFFAIVRDVRPDVLLTFQHYGNILGAVVGRILRVPYIIANQVSAPATVNNIVRPIDRLLGTVGCYDVITVNSHANWTEFQSYPQRYRRRLVHIPHGFAQKTSALPKSDARAHFGLPGGVALMGTVARLHPLKRIDLAIRTLERLPHLHLAIAGQGPDRIRLETQVAERGLGARVHFVGETTPDQIGTFLAGLDVFAFPTAAETFGLAAVEAAQAGVPVVASDLPVLREVLQVDQRPCALFVDAEDTQAFAAAIDSVLTDATLHTRLAELGRQLADRYSLARMVGEYRTVIARGPSGKERPGRQTSIPSTNGPA